MSRVSSAATPSTRFKALKEHELASLSDEMLVVHLVAARQAGDRDQVVMALRILTFANHGRVLGWVRLKVPREDVEDVACQVLESAIAGAMRAPSRESTSASSAPGCIASAPTGSPTTTARASAASTRLLCPRPKRTNGRPARINLGSYVIMLDGHVVEIMHKSGIDLRIHVNHIPVKAEPIAEGGGMDMHVGVEQGGKNQQGVRFKVPADRQAEVISLFEKAQELRED